MTFIDTHAHIYHDNFSNPDAVVERAKAAGISQVLMPNIDLDTVSAMHSLADHHPGVCFPMMGLHPCHVKEDYREVLKAMREWHNKRQYIAVGEIGIDLYWDPSSQSQQEEAFREQIGWAIDLDLPIVIHSRDALDRTIAIVDEMQSGSLTGVFHCFNGTAEQGHKIVDLGFYMGIGGVLTYKNAGIDKAVAQLPIQHMVLETDAPFLTPVRYRKKGVNNEPAFMVSVAERLAKVLDLSLETVAEMTTANAKQLFKRAF